MDLRAYLDTLPHGGVAEFATRCGIAESYLFQLASRKPPKDSEKPRVPSPALAVVFERESGGRISRKDSRPDDYADIWPDLVPREAGDTVPFASEGAEHAHACDFYVREGGDLSGDTRHPESTERFIFNPQRATDKPRCGGANERSKG